MSMEITNNYNNYSAGYTSTAKAGESTKESGVTTSTVELKTSTPGVTKTEQIKTGYSNVNDYSKYLQGKYSYMNTGTTSMQGIPTTVSVSSAFLQKCMNNSEKAKYLEENLAAIPDCVKSLVNYTKTMPGSPVCTYATYIIGDDGNITCIGGCTNDPDGKIARENAERKAKENREKQEKLEKKREEKKAEEQKAVERRMADNANKAENEYSITMQGTDVKSMTQSLVSKWNFSNMAGGASLSGFDVKA